MEATMTMPMTGFKDLSNEEAFSVDGGTNWRQYWTGVGMEFAGGGIMFLDPIAGFVVVVEGCGMAESAIS